MNYSFKIIMIIASMLFAGWVTESEAKNRGNLSARAKSSVKGVKFKKRCTSYRVNDCGKSLRCWRQQVAYRSQTDTFVYRHEGRATARDEESGPVMIFHTRCDKKLRCGHVYQRRDN